MAGVSEFPDGFMNGISIRGVPLNISNPGEVFWVNNSGVLAKGGIGASDGNPGTYKKPFSTLDYAIGRCTAGRGDVIMLMPGHTETLTAAGDITFDVNGVTVVGLGFGTLQPQLHFTTAAGVDVNITADDVAFYNVRFTAGVSDITPGALDISGDNTTFVNCLFDEDGSGENYIIVANVADGNDGLWVENCEYRGGDASNDHVFELAGTHDNLTFIGNRFHQATAQTAAAPLIESATDANNVLLKDNLFYTATAAVASSCVVLTGTGNTGWAVNNYIMSVDTDATSANFTSAFDVSGLGVFDTKAMATADGHAVVFGTAEDLT